MSYLFTEPEQRSPYSHWDISRKTEESLSVRGQDIFFFISGFHHEVDEICAALGYYAACSGNSLPTFRDNLSVPSSRVKKSKKNPRMIFLPLNMGTDRLSRNVG
jgi:hypothetical protein